MRELKIDIWDVHPLFIRCITTNGAVRKDNGLVMGAGVAKQAMLRYPDLPYILGQKIKQSGNHVYYIQKYNIASFPTKHIWQDNSDISLILQSCRELDALLDNLGGFAVLPRPGCSNGKLNWITQVKPKISMVLSDRIWVIHAGT